MNKKILFLQTNYPTFLNSFYKNNPNWKNLNYKQLMKLWAEEYFGSSNFYSKNLSFYKWRGKEIIANDKNSQFKWAKENKINTNRFIDNFLKFVPGYIKNTINTPDRGIFNIFLKQVKKFKPDVIYSHHLGLFSPYQLSKIKENTKLLVGQIASPIPKNTNILKRYDLLISSFPHFVKKFKKMGIKSEYLPWCAEENILKKVGEKKRKYNVSYVGGFTPHHSKGNKIFNQVSKNVKIDFWGYGENFLLPTSKIRKNFHGQAWGKKMYTIYASSKIVINRHINISNNYANNMRMYEATLMGALLITDEKQNMNEFFKAGKEVITYKNAKDLLYKIRYYLKHNKKRIIIARAGQRRTLKNHTYTIRMKQLDKILRKYL